MVYVLFLVAPCGFEPEFIGSAECRVCRAADGECRYLCASKRHFYARLSPDLPYMYSRPAPLDAYLEALLRQC